MDAQENYIRSHSSLISVALEWLETQTHLRTNHARMLSGPSVGALLADYARMLGARRILELGVFTGYSSICLASALPEDGILDALEINDELEELIREGYGRAGVNARIRLKFGDAKQLLSEDPELAGPYDLVYIDANKREYVEYYGLIIDRVRSGGVIIADNVLWDGKVYADTPSQDAQTQGLIAFNDMVATDSRVHNFILPIRDGINVIHKL